MQICTEYISAVSVTGWQVKMLMGHSTFLSFLRRKALAIFHTAYRFMRSEYQRFGRLWSSCREELTCFVGHHGSH